MLLFPIKIQTVPELRRYVELFMHYPIERLWLFVKEYPKGELANIEKFLIEHKIMDLERYKKMEV